MAATMNMPATTAHMDGTLLFSESLRTPPKSGPTANPTLLKSAAKPKYRPLCDPGDMFACIVELAGDQIISPSVRMAIQIKGSMNMVDVDSSANPIANTTAADASADVILWSRTFVEMKNWKITTRSPLSANSTAHPELVEMHVRGRIYRKQRVHLLVWYGHEQVDDAE